MPLAILNTSIITADGDYSLRTITLERAKTLLTQHDNEVNSAVGHQSTADILTTLLGVEVPVNRQLYTQSAGEVALVFKVNGSPPEGQILTEEQVAAIGYTFKVIVRSA